MNKLIDAIYEQNFPENTLRSILMIIYDAKPKDHEIIFKNVNKEEMATIKKKMKIVQQAESKISVTKPCDGCPEQIESNGIVLPMEKLVIKATPKEMLIEEDGSVKAQHKSIDPTEGTGSILNRFNSDKEKMIQYCREKGYDVRMNYTVLKLAQIIYENEV
ncbi:MAG: hypothetical protein E6Q39_00065 [Crocinitomicaceae bacterium]|nr:MAG: hypothetical protein E6Q39_00065 [Crocinitomicaceae bacterium]